MVQSIPCWTDIENPYRLSRASYIYNIYVGFLAWHFNDLSQVCKSEFNGWAIIELSMRRGLRTFLISWGQKTHVKHYNVDLSSWYELWFAICMDMDVILDLSTVIQQFRDGFGFWQLKLTAQPVNCAKWFLKVSARLVTVLLNDWCEI